MFFFLDLTKYDFFYKQHIFGTCWSFTCIS